MDTIHNSALLGSNWIPPVGHVSSFDPIEYDMENEEKRLQSFQRNSGWQGMVDPRRLAAAGFYYTGINDHVKCFACDTSLNQWQPDDDPVKEHFKENPTCTYISKLGNKFTISHVPSRIGLQESSSMTPSFRQPFRSTSYDPGTVHQPPPVSASANRAPASKPNYAREKARLHTFINWPKDCPIQPKELIDAGFYYTGNGDKVECFKCGIILAGWEPLDTPWGEHVKWAKNCPLVIEYLRRRNPHSPTQGPTPPTFPQEQTWKMPTSVSEPVPEPVVAPSEREDVVKVNVVKLPVEQNECPNKAEKHSSRSTDESRTEEEIFYIQKGVQKLIEEGQYEYGMINEAIQQRAKIEKRSIDSMAELLDAIRAYQEMSERKSGAKNDPIAHVNPRVGLTVTIDREALQRQVQKLEDAHRCKICLDAEIGIVFLPCGHLVCCPDCAHEIQSKRDSLCPVCRRRIESTIRSYLT